MNTSWVSWHKVVSLRPDLKSSELSLATFAADLHDVDMLRGARRPPFFRNLLQVLIELAPADSEEQALMESISNHVGGKQTTTQRLL
jgi:hypothetical protein